MPLEFRTMCRFIGHTRRTGGGSARAIVQDFRLFNLQVHSEDSASPFQGAFTRRDLHRLLAKLMHRPRGARDIPRLDTRPPPQPSLEKGLAQALDWTSRAPCAVPRLPEPCPVRHAKVPMVWTERQPGWRRRRRPTGPIPLILRSRRSSLGLGIYPITPGGWGGARRLSGAPAAGTSEDDPHDGRVLHDGDDAQPAATARTGEDIEVEQPETPEPKGTPRLSAQTK
jgi:hypothetical protein